ncbi:receptor-transporting protein 3-like [Spea bombifrons]|uniref:receptor-transporting protein 3-like n=1 Tax=Spea bombifrons TaxID=233779 RepID=UPI00234B0156|nr:receptor-transporting protein 3-like [Spea bombifrons]
MDHTESNHEWEDAFQSIQETELSQNYGHNWTLQIKNDILDELTFTQRNQGWKVYQTSSFGSFACSTCRHSWSSARVCLTFHYRLLQYSRGEVYLRLFRQQCRVCNNGIMITGLFEEGTKQEVLKRLISKIKKNCYNEKVETVVYSGRSMVTKPHEARFCEACMMGKCNRDVDFS